MARFVWMTQCLSLPVILLTEYGGNEFLLINFGRSDFPFEFCRKERKAGWDFATTAPTALTCQLDVSYITGSFFIRSS